MKRGLMKKGVMGWEEYDDYDDEDHYEAWFRWFGWHLEQGLWIEMVHDENSRRRVGIDSDHLSFARHLLAHHPYSPRLLLPTACASSARTPP